MKLLSQVFFRGSIGPIAPLAQCKPDTKTTGNTNNACVSLYRSLKLLTDDHSDFVAVETQNRLYALL